MAGLQDLRYAVRILRRRPAFTAAAILSLTLGIGANTAVFSLVHALFLETLPVEHPDRLVRLVEEGRDAAAYRDGFTYAAFDELRRGTRLLSGVAATSRQFGRPLQIDEASQRHFAFVHMVSDNYFDLLGIRAARGRVFHEPQPGGRREAIAVISDAYWREHFNRDPAAIGARFRFNGHDLAIAGIAPPGFGGADVDNSADIWISIEQVVPDDSDDRRLGRWVQVIGRLSGGATIGASAAEARAILGQQVTLRPGATGYSALRRRLSQPLFVVQLVVGVVLLIACANLATVALAGTASRARELAVRRAIGASRGRIVRQLLAESVLLAAAGGALGLVAARSMSAALLTFLPPEQARALANLRFEPDPRVLGFAALLTLATCVLFGLLPALRAARDGGAGDLKIGAGASAPQRSWMSRALLIGQIAMCTLLLMVAGVFLRSVRNLRGQDSGYHEARLLVADVMPRRELPEAQRDRMIEDLRARLASVPGVEIAAFSYVGQLSGSALEYRIGFPGRPAEASESPLAIEQRISPGFLAAMGTRLGAGRDFAATDDRQAPAVAIVNEAFARRFFPGVNPLGRRFFRFSGSRSREPMEIVGVVQDSKWINLRDEPPAMYYRPYLQQPGSPVVRLAIRASGNLDALAGEVRQAARAIDPQIVLANVVPFREIVDRTIVVERLIAEVSAAFGGMALAIAAVGLYGALAHTVARRRREIGVRIAVGASPGSIEWMIVRESLALLAAGVLIGLPVALLIGRLVSAMLFGLSPADPGTMAATITILGAATIAATYLPARRAATLDPVVVLRDE